VLEGQIAMLNFDEQLQLLRAWVSNIGYAHWSDEDSAALAELLRRWDAVRAAAIVLRAEDPLDDAANERAATAMLMAVYGTDRRLIIE
jgi:hypothetical protein